MLGASFRQFKREFRLCDFAQSTKTSRCSNIRFWHIAVHQIEYVPARFSLNSSFNGYINVFPLFLAGI